MPKTLVVCIDGTWNAPGQHDRDPITGEEVGTLSNVARTWEALSDRQLDAHRPYGSIAPLARQHGSVIYFNGVGSMGRPLTRQLQGAAGTGLAERIRDAYRFLAERWLPGDAIFGFGFSRGAFAVRSLAAFIQFLGLPNTNNLLREDELEHAYDIYRRRGAASAPQLDWTMPARIRFLGLWDTVGALSFGLSHTGYHALSPVNVDHVCHALALDEERAMFAPELWGQASPGTKVEEVWFAGAHTNVGGGYADTNLSNIALFWMLCRARDNGLVIEPARVMGWDRMDAGGPRRPSYREFWGSFPLIGDPVTRFDIARHSRPVRAHHRIHESAVEAMQQASYRPMARGSDGDLIALPLSGNVVEPWALPALVATHQRALRGMLARLLQRAA